MSDFDPTALAVTLRDRAITGLDDLWPYLNRELGPTTKKLLADFQLLLKFFRAGTDGQLISSLAGKLVWGPGQWPVVHTSATMFATAYTRVMIEDPASSVAIVLPTTPVDGDAIDVFAASDPSDGNLTVFSLAGIQGVAVTGGSSDVDWEPWQVKRYTYDAVLAQWRQS